jgi:periplasmic protein TonB
MENKKSLLITFTLIISAHLLLFANLELEEKVVVAQNKPAPNISKINLKNVVIKKPEPVSEPVVKPIVEKIIEKPLLQTKSKNIVKQEKKKEKRVKKKILEKIQKTEKTEKIKIEQKAEPQIQEIVSKQVIKQKDTIDPSQLQALENEYLSKLRYIIEKNKIYPNSAKRLNQMGKVHVNFIISKDGQIKNIKIVKNSNYQKLNDAAFEILAKINKFEPIPKELNKNSWEITVPIVYQIKRS